MSLSRANRIADAVKSIERDVTRLREIRAASLAEYTADDSRPTRWWQPELIDRIAIRVADSTAAPPDECSTAPQPLIGSPSMTSPKAKFSMAFVISMVTRSPRPASGTNTT